MDVCDDPSCLCELRVECQAFAAVSVRSAAALLNLKRQGNWPPEISFWACGLVSPCRLALQLLRSSGSTPVLVLKTCVSDSNVEELAKASRGLRLSR